MMMPMLMLILMLMHWMMNGSVNVRSSVSVRVSDSVRVSVEMTQVHPLHRYPSHSDSIFSHHHRDYYDVAGV